MAKSSVHVTFESFVNSERCKTKSNPMRYGASLRALLIRKDVKLYHAIIFTEQGLRALLIRKDVKLYGWC